MATAPRRTARVFKGEARSTPGRRRIAAREALRLASSSSSRPLHAPICSSTWSRQPKLDVSSPLLILPSIWLCSARLRGSGDPGPRAGGRDGTRCSVVLSPPILHSSRPPAPPAPRPPPHPEQGSLAPDGRLEETSPGRAPPAISGPHHCTDTVD
ncbi:uncharacterized protein LOC116423341 [Sarcophilus harrisii]|uniref:uncharacterized protein LOC116423341 n=1 Tax=Sarcophilus harrisii TaxID=9305 RepID=UPI001301A94A|nr:uncharacterized protein LOC116423341 [Sarcophilus harrisii]